MVYKYSKYNIICEEYDDTYLVFNTKTTSLAEVDKGYLHLGDEKTFLSEELSKDEMDILYLAIAPTYVCNMKCPYCYQSEEGAKKMTGEVENDILDFLKNVIEKYRHVDVRWFGGEPTLDIELIGRLSEKIIHLCDEYGVIYTANMITNGVLLSLQK